MYDLTDVTKTFDGPKGRIVALEHVNLKVGDGELLAIQGPTGQGKSTLLQLLGGIDRPTSGIVSFDGHDMGMLGEVELSRLRAEAFGFVFQTFNLLPTLNAQENVEAALVPLKVGRAERKARAAAALAELDLADRSDHLPSELSGGQQQRVAIARALVKNPKVLLADEPTGNLDEDMRDEIIGLLETLWRDRGLTLIIVTHDSAVARRAPRTALIRKGHLTIKDAQPARR
jgi:putative ABC transport system ATP-binding protein